MLPQLRSGFDPKFTPDDSGARASQGGPAVHAGSMHVPSGNDRTTRYEILVRGTVAADFVSDVGARRCKPSEGKTVIVVDVLDQSHLHGILDRLGDLNVEIESVNPE
jgi:hypothetical protein